MADKPQFVITDKFGNIYRLIDSSKDPSWFDVLAIEERRYPDGILRSVLNHRDKNFEQRRQELIAELSQHK